MRKHPLVIVLAAIVMTLTASAAAEAQCTFTTSIAKKTMKLNADCIATASIIVPNGFTLDGAGHTITATDPSGNHFTGGVIQNGGATADVTKVTINTIGLSDVCDTGANRLRGILFDSASGSITDSRVLNINQGAGSTCDEGNAIEVRNFGPSPTTSRVRIEGNIVSGYQKGGIVANGNVDATITGNLVDGLGPSPLIARNGIQLGFGATGMVKRNQVSGNEYIGPEPFAASGVLIIAGPGFAGPGFDSPYSVGSQIDQNTISENDVGVWVVEIDADGNPPSTMTNVKVVNNTISKSGVTNSYQAGVS
ncbi:MAG: right-handed parallel beta-helix repeat-containing protein, partial [Acidobacteriota bacterium]